MTIQKAIESGQPFKRPGFQTWIVCPSDKDAGLKWSDANAKQMGGNFWPREQDLLATDWIVKKPKKKVRRLAWFASYGEVMLVPENDTGTTNWVRAPWLDEPEER